MSTLRGLLRRARAYANSVVPDDVRQAGKRLGERVRESAPAPIAAAIDRLASAIDDAPGVSDATPGEAAPRDDAAPRGEAARRGEAVPGDDDAGPRDDAARDATPMSTRADHDGAPSAAVAASGASPPTPAQPTAAEPVRESTAAVLQRVKERAEVGLKPEDTLVVIYATQAEAAAVDEIVAMFDGVDTTIRVMDLDREPPQTKRQLAGLTDVMVPPYVYINGRHWGGQYEIAALAATGDLAAVTANRLDEIGPEARRIGKLQAAYSEALTVENILERWRLGHILCVDDLDAWFEVDKDGVERFFAEGGPQPLARMQELAADIARRAEAGDVDAQWRLDTVVHLH
jgi:hypothetical protein